MNFQKYLNYFNFLNTNSSSGGGSSSTASENDVEFIDYDGTIVYSYTKDEFLTLSEMPENPSHDKLIAQGWNWTLADAKEYVSNYGALIIGQMYITESGKTELDVELTSETLSPTCRLYSSVANSYEIDWGDGSDIQTLSYTSAAWKTTTHTYSSPGKYTIKYGASNNFQIVGYSSGNKTYLVYNGANSYESDPYNDTIVNIRLGQNVILNGNAFGRCKNVQSITMPNDCKTGNLGYNFMACNLLQAVVFPTTYTRISSNEFQQCTRIKRLSLPREMTTISAMSKMVRLEKICLTPNMTSLASNAFLNCYHLKKVIIPNSITDIGTNAFASCFSVDQYTFLSIDPPTLGNNAFSNIVYPTKICVPAESINAYKTATNWSAYADYIYPIEE